MQYPKIVYLEGVLMENNEIIHFGKSLGFINKRQLEMLENGSNKITKGKEPVVAVNNKVA
jgi:hypothetical protein